MPAFFQTPLSPADMVHKQAVVETTMGTFVMALMPEAAPNHVGHFIKVARDGGYNGTIFHRVVRYGIVQGGDPLTRDPAKSAQYGMGGLNELKSEFNANEKYTAGAVAAVLAGGKPDSGGSQFFICVSDQSKLDGQYTVFARIVDGLDIVAAISAVEADAKGAPAARVEIKSVTIRDTPPPAPVPFANDTAADLAKYRVKLETTKGDIVIEMLAGKAPETVRAFLQAAKAGIYDRTPFHRVVKGFVVQVGSIGNRAEPLTAAQQKWVHNLQPEFNDTPHVPGIVSMARGDAPDSAQTSFFICTGECSALDGKYTVFARVVSGMDVVRAIESAPVDGETPKDPVMIRGTGLFSTDLGSSVPGLPLAPERPNLWKTGPSPVL